MSCSGVLCCCLCFFCGHAVEKMAKVEGLFVWAGLVFEDFWFGGLEMRVFQQRRFPWPNFFGLKISCKKKQGLSALVYSSGFNREPGSQDHKNEQHDTF